MYGLPWTGRLCLCTDTVGLFSQPCSKQVTSVHAACKRASNLILRSLIAKRKICGHRVVMYAHLHWSRLTTGNHFKIKAHRTHQRISAGGRSTFSALPPDRSTLATPQGDSPYCRKRTTCLQCRNCSRSSCRTAASQGPRTAPTYILQKKIKENVCCFENK